MIARHDQVDNQRYRPRPRLSRARMQIEPHTYEGRRRNDRRLLGSAGRGQTTMDYDVKAYSLTGQHAHLATSRTPAETTTSDHAAAQCGKYLASVLQTVETRRPLAIEDFKPLVFSLGGVMEKETVSEVTRWKSEMTDTVYEVMVRRTSLVSLRARAKVYEG